MATFINPAGYLKIILGPMTSGKTINGPRYLAVNVELDVEF